MAYQNHNPYGNGYHPQQYSGAQYNGYMDPRQMGKPPIHGYASYNQNAYGADGHVDQRSSPHNDPNSMRQQQYAPQIYRPPPPQQQQRAPQAQSQRPLQPQQPPPPPPQILQQTPQQLQQQRASAVAVPASSSAPVAMSTPNMNNGYVHMSAIQEQAPQPPPLDYQLLLLSMADEYFAVAYGRGAIADMVQRETEMKEYYKLIATGLGCLEVLLKHYKLAPEREANVLLRYATVLYEETENTMEAEEALSKGISICDRYKYFDLKYNMQHLLARAMFGKNSKAAFKFLDRVMADAQAYQHIAWVYAFKFLKVSLHLDQASHQDLTAALGQLRTVINLASEYGDKAILAMATTMEAIVCLKGLGESEGFEQAQRALAGVRSLQLDPAISSNRQLAVFISFVDISCHLRKFDPAQALSSMQNMQNVLASIVDNEADGADGSFAIPVPNATLPGPRSGIGAIKQKADRSSLLIFNWMPNEDIYNVGFLMSGIAMAHKNTTDGQKSEQMFSQGVQRQEWAQRASSKSAKTIMLATTQQSWREQMAYYMRIHHAFTLAARTSWTSAQEQVTQLRSLRKFWLDVPHELFLLSQYLKGTIAQGTGDLQSAFSTYQSIIDTVSPAKQNSQAQQAHSQLRAASQLSRELYLLSTLNTLQIIRDPAHLNHYQSGTLLSQIAALCTHSPNRGIVSAYHLISAACPMSSTIIITKHSLQSALQAAKATANNQLMCMVLNIMSWKFFSGVIGEQAEKSARASQTLAKKGGDALWSCVAAGVLAETLEAAGRIEEASQARAEGEKHSRELPEKIQETMFGTKETDTMMSGTYQSYETPQ